MEEKTKIQVYSKTPFKNDYDNVIWFKNEQELENLLLSHHVKEIYSSDNLQQIGRMGEVYLEGRVEKFENATYMRFRNNGRIMYAFVLNVVYINERTTLVIYEIDVFNTYQFELQKSRVMGYIEQSTLPNDISELRLSSQGFSKGTPVTVASKKVGVNVEWLVIVAKPDITLSTKEKLPKSNMSFSGMQKAFKYFVVPIDLDKKMTYPYEIGGIEKESFSLLALFKELFGIGDKDGETPVNSIVNMYVSRAIGIDYIVDNGVVRIKTKIDDFTIVDIGQTETRTTPSANGTTGGGGSLSDDGDISTLDGRVRAFTRAIKKAIPNATPNGIASIAGAFEAESNLTARRYEADYATGYQYDKMEQEPTAQNLLGSWQAFYNLYASSPPALRPAQNGTGYEVGGKMYLGVGLGQWTGVRSKALWEFAKTKGGSIFSFGVQVEFILTESKGGVFSQYATSNDSIDSLVQGFLANWLGVAGNKLAYRQGKAREFLPIVTEELSKSNGSQPQSQPQSQPKGTPQTDQAISTIMSTKGTRVGSGQCYGIVAYYSQLLGGASLGGGINTPIPDGNGRQAQGSDTRRGMSASNIGGDYNWSAKGWSVTWDITWDNLKVGAIVNYKPVFGNQWGHTAVVIGKGSPNSYTVIEQNNPGGHYYVVETVYNGLENIESFVYPPEVIQSGGASSGLSGGVIDTGNGTSSVEQFWGIGSLLYIRKFYNFIPLTFSIPNLLKETWLKLNEVLKEPEIQLLNSEFCEIELYDIFGNSFTYQPELLPRDLNSDNYTVVLTGTLGNNNMVHVGLLDYNNTNGDYYYSNDIKDIGNVGWQTHHSEHYKYGFNDTTGRDLTILNDNVASWFQANKNQNEATKLTFKENKEMVKKNASLANAQTKQANKEATYNADYAVDTAKINGISSGVSALGNIVGGALTGGVVGAIGGGISGGFGMYNAYRGHGNALKQEEFAFDNNMLRKQSTALSNMQAKQAINQSIRSYNSALKDLENQPLSVQQIGNDLAFQSGNDISDIFWKISIPQKEVLIRANTYIKMFGVLRNEHSQNILGILDQREKFDYIKCINVVIQGIDINQDHYNALVAIFQTGVRFWYYDYIIAQDVAFKI